MYIIPHFIEQCKQEMAKLVESITGAKVDMSEKGATDSITGEPLTGGVGVP